MSIQTDPLNISDSELQQLNHRHIHGVDKWFRMFMNLASEIQKIERGVIYLDVTYSRKVRESKAEIVARTWLHAPKNNILRRAESVVVNEYTDKGKPGDFIIFKNDDDWEEVLDNKNLRETERFGESRWFMNRHIFVVDSLLTDHKSG